MSKNVAGYGLALKESHAYILLAAVSLLARLPFWKTFALVTYDGTFYLNQARALQNGMKMPGQFPVGYPAFVAFFNSFIKDTVTAAQVVSLLAGVGAVVLLYALAKHYVRREFALLCALILAVTPLAIHSSLVTMSESLYVFWVLLGSLLFVRKRYLFSGLAIGAAAITRPEALLIAVILALSKRKRARQLATMTAGFLFVFMINAAFLSWSADRLIILPKTMNIGLGATSSGEFDKSFEFAERDEALAKYKAENPDKSFLAYYVERLPGEWLLFLRYLFPFLLVLSIVGLWRKRPLALSAPLAFLVLYPIATPKSEDRFILPYIPFVLVLAMIGLESIRSKNIRLAVLGGVVLSTIVSLFVNSHAFRAPIDAPLILHAKDIAGHLGNKIKPWEKIADRKPYLAFYTGAGFTMIPLAPYHRTMQFLCDARVDYLALNRHSIDTFRPALSPLLHDKAAVAGELRFDQLLINEAGEIIMERVRDAEPLTWQKLPRYGEDSFAPCWSPDGGQIAFRSLDKEGRGSICIASAGQTAVTEIAEESTSQEQIAWSPDGRLIAFPSSARGNVDLYFVEIATKKLTQITSSEGNDLGPSWSPDGDRIAFHSDRTGQNEIWVLSLSKREESQLTSDGGNTNPAFSPSGDRIAWIKATKQIDILNLETGDIVRHKVATALTFAPTWSPDGRYLAITTAERGNWDVYLIRSDGRGALALTKDLDPQGMPAWNPNGQVLAIHSTHEGGPGVWFLGGLAPYLESLNKFDQIITFK